jgi:hypothetical protein
MEGGFKCLNQATVMMGIRDWIALSFSKIHRSAWLSRVSASVVLQGAGPMAIVLGRGPTCTLQPCVAGAGEREMPHRNRGVHPFSATRSRKLGPPSQLEIVLFWTVGLATTILSGAVAIYASHFHLWN